MVYLRASQVLYFDLIEYEANLPEEAKVDLVKMKGLESLVDGIIDRALWVFCIIA
jgi:hypothetical protein